MNKTSETSLTYQVTNDLRIAHRENNDYFLMDYDEGEGLLVPVSILPELIEALEDLKKERGIGRAGV